MISIENLEEDPAGFLVADEGKDDEDIEEEQEQDQNDFMKHLTSVSGKQWFWENDGTSAHDKWIGIVGDIEKKLNKNNLKFIHKRLFPDFPLQLLMTGFIRPYMKVVVTDILRICKLFYGNDDYLYPMLSRFDKMYKEFKEQHKIKDTNDNLYLHNQRMIILIDRRHLSCDDRVTDHLWMYEPPSNCRNIPVDPVPEWYISASKTCLLPNMNYGDGKEAEMGIYHTSLNEHKCKMNDGWQEKVKTMINENHAQNVKDLNVAADSNSM